MSRTARRNLDRRPVLAVLVILVAALGAGGCGTDPATVGPDSSRLQGASPELQRQVYKDTLAQMQATIEDPAAPPFQMSIDKGNKRQLVAASQRWDKATTMVSSAQPPKEAVAANRDLVKAMRGLGEWNRRIAQAAPSRRRTKRIARQATESADARAFNESLDRLARLGYIEDAAGDPLAGAGSPVQ